LFVSVQVLQIWLDFPKTKIKKFNMVGNNFGSKKFSQIEFFSYLDKPKQRSQIHNFPTLQIYNGISLTHSPGNQASASDQVNNGTMEHQHVENIDQNSATIPDECHNNKGI
jgi:hypothetical protein